MQDIWSECQEYPAECDEDVSSSRRLQVEQQAEETRRDTLDQLRITTRAPGRPKILRTGSVGRPKKIYQTREVERSVTSTDANEVEDFAGSTEITLKNALKIFSQWRQVVSTLKDVSSGSDSDFGAKLVANMRNDANLDLSADEEYEDLRAELLAYHTALASLASEDPSRRSMMSTPCWSLGGICVNHKLCKGFPYLSEVPGCKNRLNVCCFTWNKFDVRDMRDKGIQGVAMPWGSHNEFGGKGIIDKEPVLKTKRKKVKTANRIGKGKTLALIIKAKK
ncbi:hypothetical protein K1T71_003182 [Dendrolimus kikuchii]|uniref:Uncharacterized protein n=1 Tax=Dendrolimus kikuchii TaxID=765133 RepID=A0ACC1DB44_9NEOP|nr:hypothetical protein K1T71_003182 [Dendrolimus kikuchii]